MVEIDAASRPARAHDMRRPREGSAACLVEPAAGRCNGAPCDPQAATARVARDRLAAVTQDPQSHDPNGI